MSYQKNILFKNNQYLFFYFPKYNTYYSRFFTHTKNEKNKK